MQRKTQPVPELVTEVVDHLPKPWGEDVIQDVCTAIADNPEWMERYTRLRSVLTRDVVNNWIGLYTKQIVDMKTLRQVSATDKRLIGSYKKLAP